MRVPVRPAAGLIVLLLASSRLPAQEAAPPVCPASSSRVTLSQGVDLCAEVIQEAGRGSYTASGGVTIVVKAQGSRLQADKVTVEGGKIVQAEGNVLIVWAGTNRISGERMTYDIDTGNGTVDNAFGQVASKDSAFYFNAVRVEKIGEDHVRLEKATITTCTQPVAYWSFSVSTANIRLDHYAHMWNPRLKVRRIPMFYLPYLLWPVKPDRAAGLLLPSFGSTRDRGNVYTLPLFLPFGSSADLTVFGEYYTRAGWGAGGDVRWIPNRDGRVDMHGFFINDQVSGTSRYNLALEQTQKFLNGFRMVADINQVSDFAYYTDYEREIGLVSSPTILARLEFSRNGNWTSLNVRELRREQLFSDGTSLVQQTLPQIEWRGRSHRLGNTPLYFSYESSLASIQQQSSRIDANYLRGDFFPTLTAPWSPRSWLDITPAVNMRATYWSQSQKPGLTVSDPVDIRDDALSRLVAGASVEIVGPKFFRIFERPGDTFSAKYKHTFEPRVAYVYQEAYDRNADVIVYDAVDGQTGAVDQIVYGIRSRLIAKRPRARPEEPVGEGEKILVQEGEAGRLREVRGDGASEARTEQASGPPQPTEPVEIATVEVSQNRSFDRPISFADFDRDGINEVNSFRSPVTLSGRLNPSRKLSVDLRSQYDILYKRFSDTSLSGTFKNDVVSSRFSLVRRAGLQVGTLDSTLLSMAATVNLMDGRIRVGAEGSYNPTATGIEKKVPDQRWRVEYYTQCCGFLAEYLARDFSTIKQRDFRLAIDLRGIGKLLDVRGQTQN